MKSTAYRNTAYLIILLAAVIIVAAGCKKKNNEEEPEPTPATTPAFTSEEDASMVEGFFNDADKETDVIIKDTLFYKNMACPNMLSIDTSLPLPYGFELDYGTSGCPGSDGIIRKGKIIVSLSGRYIDSATTVVINFFNFYINNYKVEGKKARTNWGRSCTYGSNVGYHFSLLDSGKVTDPTGTVGFPWYSRKDICWYRGDSTKFNPFDDEFAITIDSISGMNRKGKMYSAKTVPGFPLIKKNSCRWVAGGRMEVTTPSESVTRRIDFGSGACDSIATVTCIGSCTDNNTYTIILK